MRILHQIHSSGSEVRLGLAPPPFYPRLLGRLRKKEGFSSRSDIRCVGTGERPRMLLFLWAAIAPADIEKDQGK